MTNLVRTELEAAMAADLPDNAEQVITASRLRSACTDLNDTIFREDAIALQDKTGRLMLQQGGYLLRDSQNFLPTNISGLVLWLDAADRGTTTDQWDDKSGQDNHWTSTTGQFPTFGSEGATFAGSHRLRSTALATLNPSSAEIFMRLRSTTANLGANNFGF